MLDEKFEKWAKMFHESYERLAPSFGYKTRKESAVPWEWVPDHNRKLMIAVCGEVVTAAMASQREQLEASVAVERKDCEKALLALAGHYPTPVEGYGCNTSWAISDLYKCVASQRAQLKSVREAYMSIERDLQIESAAAYAKGASDMREAAALELEQGHEKMCLCYFCNTAYNVRALPIPSAQPRDLSRLWELVEHWKSEGKRCYDLANSKPSKVEQTVMAQSVRFWNCADELAAILKEMEEGSR